ncbi:ketose-bisphosphate aldolase class-II family protein [Arabidopsis thaliana]|uniref:Ketose-bisphosphate aldolase class-II family protein n=1 Tax=Arabidopsis thaliana TaxID=3702 RepID=B3H739_ARATH|nr:ketose-bisphosphate aldolase class-II family protein [Arabidopsis thaliana]AEE29695.1 ketose-bisphosphate aldolase class-II family protein [Arabidopsis thaliana]|eukprot:NP_001117303.1 ketose-bisphosphate aldolase class-II family protein [Arabidopsis thaliana]
MSGVVGFVGLDSFSFELASSLLRSGFKVQAFEISTELVEKFIELGGHKCDSPADVGKAAAAAVVVVLSHPDQIQDVIFGDEGVMKGLQKDAVLLLSSTISTLQLQKLEKQLTEKREQIFVVDAYVLKGMSELLDGKLMIIASGRSDSITRAQPYLTAMCQNLYTFEGEIGAGSKVKMVNELLEGIHLVAAVEAISLGSQAGVHPWILYDIISNAAGNSWIYKNHIPLLLKDDIEGRFLDVLSQNLAIVEDKAKSLPFPVPLLAVARQQLISGISQMQGDDTATSLAKISEKVLGVGILEAANRELYKPEDLAKEITTQAKPVNRIGFIGLGAMGFGMAAHLLKSNFSVCGYDVYKPTLVRFENAGGLAANSPAEVTKDVDVLVIMVTNEVQAEDVLYGHLGAVEAIPSGATVVLASTVSPAFVSQLERRLENEGKDLKLVDAPVSGGVKRAAMGELTIMASGTDEALKSAGLVLSALSEKLYVIKGGCGAGSGVKMVNQLLAGVHIASAAEAMAFGARLGLNTRKLFNVISNSGGTSWMFENRVPHMLDNDYTPYSALDIFVKDLGIVTREGSSRKVPLHISTVAHQLFLAGSAAGWGRIDDAGVVKVYETLAGIKVEGRLPVLKKQDLLKSLPAEWPSDPTTDIHRLNMGNSKTLVVLDDDPTGTQTVHDVEVLTEWSVESISEQFRKKPACFFILTNSRSLSPEKASELIKDICSNLCAASKEVGNADYTIVLRGDSTLRGHFPQEADAAVSILGEMDAWIICPFFLQGGRYTIDDVHYVADSDRLVPAGETEFAKDASFGYKSSNLREWVEEKTAGVIPANSVQSISIQLLRKGGPDAVCEFLCSLKKGSTCIVNAASERDMAVFAAGMIQAELKGRSFLCRTAASFVSALIGIIPKDPVLPKDFESNKESSGALIVVGSYVPKTTKQVEELQSQHNQNLRSIEISVEKVALKSSEVRDEEIRRAVEMADAFLRAGRETLIMSSRELITGKTSSESLDINSKVSSALVEVVSQISTRPRYILAKGGITSSDTATKALKARRALVIGQALAGVPVWKLGPESRHPGVPYIVFPGNVGNSTALAEVVKSWSVVAGRSTKELLLNAEKGGYAVGAFNVYNLEGIEAVVAAAEEENSPAILQVHPGAFKQGGIPLVSCCISAAEQARVPISVHFDHGTTKHELLEALELGLDSVMVDGSHLSFTENLSYTKSITELARSKNIMVEAELGRLSGTEDGLTVEDYEAKLTNVNQAQEFMETGIDALAVCIGNVHGKYPKSGPNLKLDLLKELHALSSKKGVFLVLHGASGLSENLIKECIENGVRKFNVNTEVRTAYMEALSSGKKTDIVDVMSATKAAMKAVIADKIRLFGSAGKA